MPDNDLIKTLVEQQSETLKEVKEMNLKYYQLSEDFSNYINSQDKHNLKMRSYLEDDPNSRRQGVVSKVDNIENRILHLEKEFIKKSAGIAVGASGVVFALKWIIGKLIV